MDKKYTIDDLLEILKILRSENGCPWDRAQTHDSIKKSMIEETYEALDALDSGDDAAFANELGDVLLQVAFHAALAKERGAFDFDDILREICTKLITRHTHVFGNDKAATAEDALGTWEKNKKKEKGLKTDTELLKDVPHGLPALMRAQKVQKKAASCGFDSRIFGRLSKRCPRKRESLQKPGRSFRKKKFPRSTEICCLQWLIWQDFCMWMPRLRLPIVQISLSDASDRLKALRKQTDKK